MILFALVRTVITESKDFWPLMGQIKQYPSGRHIDAHSDAKGHNGTDLVIKGWNWFKWEHVTPCEVEPLLMCLDKAVSTYSTPSQAKISNLFLEIDR